MTDLPQIEIFFLILSMKLVATNISLVSHTVIQNMDFIHRSLEQFRVENKKYAT